VEKTVKWTENEMGILRIKRRVLEGGGAPTLRGPWEGNAEEGDKKRGKD